jgi:hypothetical protein
MSCTPYGLAVAIIGKKEGKTKNVTHAVWSGRNCHWAKKIKNEKCHPSHMVWPWLSSAKKKAKQKMSCTPYGLAMAVTGKKEGKT